MSSRIISTRALIFPLSLEKMTTFYFVRVHLQTENVSTFKNEIRMINDGNSYVTVGAIFQTINLRIIIINMVSNQYH